MIKNRTRHSGGQAILLLLTVVGLMCALVRQPYAQVLTNPISESARRAAASSNTYRNGPGPQPAVTAGMNTTGPVLGADPSVAAPKSHSPSGTSGPKIWLQESQPLPVQHASLAVGKGNGMTALNSGTLAEPDQSLPVAMASADLDQDGIDDLLIGYGTGSSGFISIHRGNLDAFAPQTHESFLAIAYSKFPSPFLLQAKTFSVPVSPDFIALGDFSGNGWLDLVIASRGGNAIYVFPNDGSGTFGPPLQVQLTGAVTALAAGNLGIGKSFTSILVGVSGLNNTYSLLILGGTEPGLGTIATFPLTAPASNFNFGDFGDKLLDAAFLSGGQVVLLHSSSMSLETLSLPVSASAMTLGSFIYDRNLQLQIAVLGSDGSIQIAAHSEFDPRRYTHDELLAIRNGARRGWRNPLIPVKAVPMKGWKIVESIAAVAPFSAGQVPVLLRTRITNHGADDVMVLNGSASQMAVVFHPDTAPGATTFLPAQISTRPYDGSPVTAISTRVNVDGRPGIVALQSGQAAPSVMMPIPDPTFFVNRFDDPAPTSPIANACNNTSFADVSSSCSLREAILKANGDTIMVPAGTITLTRPKVAGDYSGQNGALYVNHSMTIVGAGQNSTIIQAGTNATNGVDMVMAVNEDINPLTDATASISNLTLKFGHNNGTSGVDGDGGCMEFDTGTSGNANLTLTNVTLSDCSTTDGLGGGIALFDFLVPTGTGQATFTNCTIQNNSAFGAGGRVGSAGGIWDSITGNVPAKMVINNSQILNNKATQVVGSSAGSGGGILIFGPANGNQRPAIHGSTISGNQAAGTGGGIWTTSGIVIDQGTVISGNSAGSANVTNLQDGGGIWMNISPDTADITKVTITGNSTTGNGGGIHVDDAGGTVNLSFSRIVGNTAGGLGSNLHNRHDVNPDPGTVVTAQNNWWGTNTPSGTIDPSTSNCPAGAHQICFDPWIVLTHSANPARIRINQSSTLTGDMSTDNHGNGAALAGNLDVLNALPITFNNAVLGTISEAQPESLSASAQATATYNAGTAVGIGSADARVDQQTVTAQIAVLQPPSITKSFNPTTVQVNAPSTLTFTLTNGNVVTINTSFADNLPANLVVAATPNVVNNCGGTVTAAAGTGSIGFLNGALAVGACTITVNVRGTTEGVFNNSVTIDSTDAGNGNTSSASLSVINPPTIVKSFGAATVPLNGSTPLSFTITNSNTTSTLNGIAFTDNLPAGLVVATPSGLTGTCGGGTITAAAGSPSVSVSAASLAPSSSCTFSVNVTGTTEGVKNNSVTVSSTNGGTGNTSNASLTVAAPPVIIKAFGAASIPLNGATSLTFTIQNNNTTTTLTGVGFTDTLPAGLVVSTPNGLTGSCGGGTITATQGTTGISLSGATLAASTSCTFSVNVTGTAAGIQNNTTGNVTSTEGGTGGTASTSIFVVAPPSIAKQFNPATIALAATSSLTFTITNPAANPVALTGVAFADTLPTGLTVANASAAVCGGTLTTTAPTGIALSGATLAINSQCQFSVTVTGAASGQYTNTTGTVTSTNGGPGNTATANLTVANPPTITKAFGAATVPLNGSTSLSFTVTNPGANTIALTGVAFTDNLPAGLVVSTPNGLAGSCGGGTITATAASSTVSLSGATLAANTSCTFSVNVTGTTAGVKNNSVTVASTEGGTGNTSNASLTVVGPPVIIKAFGAASIPLNGATSLTFTIQNNNTTTTLTGVGFTDTLPAGLVVSTPNGLTGSCGGGTITATQGTTGISLSGATLAASTSCTFSVDVMGTSAGTKNNTTSAVTSVEGGTGGTASASLAVAAPPTITKAFGTSNIPLNGSTTLTFTIANPSTNPVVLTGIAFVDTFPAGLQVAATPGAVNNCGGTFTANAGASSVSFSGGTLGPAAAKSSRSVAVISNTCTISVTVTGTTSGVLNNTTGVISSVESGPGATSNTASLTVAENADLALSKATLTTTPQAGSNLVYTLTAHNAGPLTATGVQVTDTLPANLSFVSATGPANWSCALGAGSVVTCSKSTSMAVGETAALTLTLALDCGIADKVSIANTAAVSFPGTDPNAANNTSTATIQTSNPAAISPVDQSFGPAGGDGIVKITFAGSCQWTASSNAGFLTINGPSSGSGDGEIHFTVAPNTGNSLRSGTMSIAGFTFTVTQTAVGEALLTAPGGGAGSLLTGGQGNNAQAGYAIATPVLSKSAREADTSEGLFSTAVLSLTQNGVVVSEAGVPAEPATAAARIFVDVRTNVPAKSDDLNAGTINVSTGIAVVNLGTAAANLTFTLRGPDGTALTVGHGSLLAGGHRARFLDQLSDVAPGFVLPGNFGSAIQFGTLEVTSDQPISVVGLRLLVNQRGETLLTTTPSVDLTQGAGSGALIFPQMADGGGYRTTVLLLNSTAGVETGTLQILDDHGSPLSVRPVGGVAGTSFAYSIAANGVFVFETDGSPATVHAGSIRVLPDGFKPTPAGAGIFSYEPGATVVTQSGVPSATPTSHALIYVDLSGGHDTGLALMNPNNQSLSVQLQAFQTDGLTPAGTIATITLPPNGHLAAFVDQLVSGLPTRFTGVLNLSAPAPFAALTLRSLVNTRGESLLTLFPIADFNQSASIPMVFPQIADGGGYRTQIIVANTNPLTATVLISFFDDNGNLLDVVK